MSSTKCLDFHSSEVPKTILQLKMKALCRLELTLVEGCTEKMGCSSSLYKEPMLRCCVLRSFPLLSLAWSRLSLLKSQRFQNINYISERLTIISPWFSSIFSLSTTPSGCWRCWTARGSHPPSAGLRGSSNASITVPYDQLVKCPLDSVNAHEIHEKNIKWGVYRPLKSMNFQHFHDLWGSPGFFLQRELASFIQNFAGR